MQKAVDKVVPLREELSHLLDQRSRLTQERNSTQDAEKDRSLSERIIEINRKLLPNLRKRIHDAYNAAKGTDKHLLAELIKRFGDALNGIGTFRVVDVSKARFNSLKRQQGVAKSHREARQITGEIREMEQAWRQWRKQQEALANEQSRREQNDAEIRRLDEILYGHLQKKD